MVYVSDNKHLFIPIGISGSMKSTWARANFNHYEIGGGDNFRALLAGETYYGRAIDKAAFELLDSWVKIQLENDVMICIDNLNLKMKYYKKFVDAAREHGYVCHAVVMEESHDLRSCISRVAARQENNLPEQIIREQHNFFTEKLDWKAISELFDVVHLHSLDMPLEVFRAPPTIRDDGNGIIFVGDLHSQFDKLQRFLHARGISVNNEGVVTNIKDSAPNFIFLGDSTDRGPKPVEVLRTVRGLVEEGYALAVMGNHDSTLKNAMKKTQKNVKSFAASTQETVAILQSQLEQQEYDEIQQWLESLPLVVHGVSGGRTYVASHAGVRYIEGNMKNTESLPNSYERDIIMRGFMDGTREKRPGTDKEFRTIIPPAYIFDNAYGPTQVHGHYNASEKETGTFTVPYHTGADGRIICLESHIESGDEYDVGWLHINGNTQ